MNLSQVRTFFAALRPRWAWICVGLGLPWVMLGDRLQKEGGCFTALGGLVFTTGFLALLVVGGLWLWRRLLFRVSRRLWVILLLLSFLPALILSMGFLSVAWLGLGGQVSRTVQASLRSGEAALRRATQEPDRVALMSLKGIGGADISRVDTLPAGVSKDFIGLVWDGRAERVVLRAVCAEEGRYRFLDLPLEGITEQGRDLWGGLVHYRLDPVEQGGPRSKVKGEEVGSGFIAKSKPPLKAWSVGSPLKGRFLLHPFTLPAVGLGVQDWDAPDRNLQVTATPETSLAVLWGGYGYSGQQGNRSVETLVIQLVLALIFLGLLAFQLVAMVTGLMLALQLGRSIDDLFVGVSRLAAGDFTARIRPRTKDQVGGLARAFNDLARDLEASIAERRQRQALEEELRVAREVQMHLLPDIPQLPMGASVHATILPARDVAGDYYDLFRLADGRLAFLIADVSGKGTSAAFYAAETKGVVAALDKVARGPREVVSRLNEIWCDTHSRRLFMTLCYGTFDPATGVFAFVRCGHPPAFLRRADGTVLRLQPKGLGIGLSRDRFLDHLELAEGRLDPGECLLLFTDGLSEASGMDRELFGEDRIEAVVAAEGPAGLQQRLLAAVAEFTGGEPPEDDLTLLILQRS